MDGVRGVVCGRGALRTAVDILRFCVRCRNACVAWRACAAHTLRLCYICAIPALPLRYPYTALMLRIRCYTLRDISLYTPRAQGGRYGGRVRRPKAARGGVRKGRRARAGLLDHHQESTLIKREHRRWS